MRRYFYDLDLLSNKRSSPSVLFFFHHNSASVISIMYYNTYSILSPVYLFFSLSNLIKKNRNLVENLVEK